MIEKLKSIPGRIANLGKNVWKPSLLAVLGVVVLSLLGLVIYWAVRPDIAPSWTGFSELVSGQYTYTTEENIKVVLAKTLWDWMGLLIVPVVLGAGVFLLNNSQRKNEQEIAKESRETDRQIARDRQHQTTLETYFDRMTDLLLEKKLRSSEKGDEVRSIARTRTLAVLRSLNAERVGAVFRFIEDAKLKDVISLAEGNLMEVNWSGADLYKANLRGADLSGAFLSGASLIGADLIGAYLIGADLSGAGLYEANLSGASLVGGADLSGAFLNDADLRGAYLNDADLRGAYLIGAYLSGADLSGADLQWAKNYTDEQLRAAISLKGATMPDGTKYEEWIKTHAEDGQAQSQEADEQPKVDEQSAE